MLEFKEGDVVTWHAYADDKPITARVLKASMVMSFPSGEMRPNYKLEGISKSLITNTSGISIIESKLFQPALEAHELFK